MSENTNPEEIRQVLSDVEGQVDTTPVEAPTIEETPTVEEQAPAAEPAAAEPEAPVDAPAEAAEPAAAPEAAPEEAPAEKADSFADKTLAELSDLFGKLKDSAERMTRSKEAESIKSAFYKLLGRLKGESGVSDDAESS